MALGQPPLLAARSDEPHPSRPQQAAGATVPIRYGARLAGLVFQVRTVLHKRPQDAPVRWVTIAEYLLVVALVSYVWQVAEDRSPRRARPSADAPCLDDCRSAAWRTLIQSYLYPPRWTECTTSPATWTTNAAASICTLSILRSTFTPTGG